MSVKAPLLLLNHVASDSFRRPKVEDQTAFWYVSAATWEELLDEAGSPDKRAAKVAIHRLRKYDAAGRIMETDEGVAAPHLCWWCTREGFSVECRVWRTKDEKPCAYCRRQGKSGCNAKDPPPPPEPPRPNEQQRMFQLEHRLARSEAKVESLQIQLEELKALIMQQNGYIQQLAREFANIGNDFKTTWDRLFPDADRHTRSASPMEGVSSDGMQTD